MPLQRDADARRFFDLSPELLCIVSAEGRVLAANPAWTRLLGWPISEVEGQELAQLVLEEDRAILADTRSRMLNGEPTDQVESRLLSKDGAQRVVRWRGMATDGRIFAVAHDITDLRESERELREKSRLMAQANAELNRFAAVVAHDLQAPVRKLMMFGERLESLGGDHLPGPLADMIRRMRASAERISVLVNDMHLWSRASSAPLEITRLDLGRVVQDVLSDLEDALDRSGAEVEAGPMPTIEASPTLMRMLLQNLIANAIKFQIPGTIPKVKVTCVWTDTEAVLTVSDNGIGIEPQYHERVFGIFQRLHNFEKYPGSGVGLATCAKVAERHHGSIRVESAAGQGASFHVTLPIVQPVD